MTKDEQIEEELMTLLHTTPHDHQEAVILAFNKGYTLATKHAFDRARDVMKKVFNNAQ